MERRRRLLNPLVAAALAFGLAFAVPAGAQADDKLDTLLEELAQPDLERWQRVERQIVAEWSRSGSAAMDLLLQRGRAALEDGDTEAAIEHLTALVDHAPGFAEGWYSRATAYFQAGAYGPAMRDLYEALALNPRHFGALTGLGTILEETDQRERALEAYREAIAIHPHQPSIKRALERLERALSGFEA
ncbi:tetratricopeptide repeat protein [Alkalilacustris brevis]|uniref:tetratricopeptide repeat protein n=1 Tax=Alkalilacustris brevis TaxID=2026338 RepID=UPI001EE4E398|nr:tetratricopeptide repeat protein [Alkalilacustris brevis]